MMYDYGCTRNLSSFNKDLYQLIKCHIYGNFEFSVLIQKLLNHHHYQKLKLLKIFIISLNHFLGYGLKQYIILICFHHAWLLFYDL
jgi:hypothetical protein